MNLVAKEYVASQDPDDPIAALDHSTKLAA
jgi:hypothetical protein